MANFGAGQGELLSVGSAPYRSTALGLAQIDGDSYARDELGGLVSQQTPRGREYFHLDALGSVRALTTASGTVSRRFDYDSYGRDIGPDSPGASTSRLGYAGGELAAPGVYHFGERFYDPQIARWTQQDPLNQAMDLRQANRYTYVGGDPVNLTDATGLHLSTEEEAGCLAASTVVGIGVSVALSPVLTPFGSSYFGAAAGSAFGYGCTVGAEEA